jgi:hypothetical protein
MHTASVFVQYKVQFKQLPMVKVQKNKLFLTVFMAK